MIFHYFILVIIIASTDYHFSFLGNAVHLHGRLGVRFVDNKCPLEVEEVAITNDQMGEE